MSTQQQPTTAEAHQSAVGRNVVPETSTRDSTTNTSTNTNTSEVPEGDYPPQKHAGAVGYGPNWHAKPGFSDKVTAMKEQVFGKVTGNAELSAKGHDRWTGELRQKELAADAAEDPFANPEEKKAEEEGVERKSEGTERPPSS
ncbi:Calmodulin-like protein [Mycena kentingensis (nom. inval.)]|nr:Calmodulin-like protein [Mycena kentingensis (nom. inval.)]